MLRNAIEAHFAADLVRQHVRVPASAPRLRARLFELGTVLEEQIGENGDALMEIIIRPASLRRLCRREGLENLPVAKSPRA